MYQRIQAVTVWIRGYFPHRLLVILTHHPSHIACAIHVH
jgi:hypothetical protein